MMRLTAGLLAVFLASSVCAVPMVEEKPKESKMAQVRTKLHEPVSTPTIEPNTPVKEMLDFLSERFDVNILIDSEAFKAIMIEEAENQPVKLRKMDQVRLHTILRLTVAQMQGDYYIQPDGVIYVVPRVLLVSHQLRQTVQAKFDKKPLQEAVQELQELTGFNIVLDARRAGDKVKTPISAHFNEVNLEAAIRVLADLAELRAVLIDNVYYLTSTENAIELQKEQDKRREEESGPKPQP